MRVLIETKRKNDDGWAVSYTDPQTGLSVAPDRVLTRCDAPNRRFPLPPTQPKPPPADPQNDVESEGYKLYSDQTGNEIKAALERVSRADYFALDVKRFGRYLFQVLLGENWGAVSGAAGTELELEMMLEAEDQDLGCLPWEMMWGHNGALGAQADRKIAITRVIPVADGKLTPVLAPIQLPLRVLFVVGRQIDDTLRPGAELIGILRRVMLPTVANPKVFQTTDLYVRYLTEATWDEIETANTEFRPTVIHIVSHGELDPDKGGTRLLLTASDKTKASGKSKDSYRCSAERLLEVLSAGGLPPVIVVNACHTAESTAQEGVAAKQIGSDCAFAAQLVRGGVAIALGMSGEVTDRACQIFTTRFYQALLQGLPAPLAAAKGRRAALLEFPVDLDNMEWARPTVFIARGVQPVLRILPGGQDTNGIARRYRLLNAPEALCDRYDCLQKYEDFRQRLACKQGATPVMAFTVKDPLPGVGKTRLLEEMAANAVFDNFLPVLVRNNIQNPAAPRNFLELALQISNAIREARVNFSLPEKLLTNAEKLAYCWAGIDPTPEISYRFTDQKEKLTTYLNANCATGKPATLKVEDFASIIQDDCRELLQDLPAGQAASQTVVLLLDDLHRYSGMSRLLVEKCREFGLGKAGQVIPLVFTYVANETEGKALEEALRNRLDICASPLGVFQSPIDDRLAFAQFVLSFHKLAVSSRKDTRDDVEWFYENMKDLTGGRPSRFAALEVTAIVRVFSKNALIKADYEALLAKWP